MEYTLILDEFNNSEQGQEQQDFYENIAQHYDEVYIPLLTSNPAEAKKFLEAYGIEEKAPSKAEFVEKVRFEKGYADHEIVNMFLEAHPDISAYIKSLPSGTLEKAYEAEHGKKYEGSEDELRDEVTESLEDIQQATKIKEEMEKARLEADNLTDEMEQVYKEALEDAYPERAYNSLTFAEKYNVFSRIPGFSMGQYSFEKYGKGADYSSPKGIRYEREDGSIGERTLTEQEADLWDHMQDPDRELDKPPAGNVFKGCEICNAELLGCILDFGLKIKKDGHQLSVPYKPYHYAVNHVGIPKFPPIITITGDEDSDKVEFVIKGSCDHKIEQCSSVVLTKRSLGLDEKGKPKFDAFDISIDADGEKTDLLPYVEEDVILVSYEEVKAKGSDVAVPQFTFSNQHGRKYNTLGIAFSLLLLGKVRHYPANVYEIFLRECGVNEDGEREIYRKTGSTILRMPKFEVSFEAGFKFENIVEDESTGGKVAYGSPNQLGDVIQKGKVKRSSGLKLAFGGEFSAGFNDDLVEVEAGAAIDLVPFFDKTAAFFNKMNRTRNFSAGGLKLPFHISAMLPNVGGKGTAKLEDNGGEIEVYREGTLDFDPLFGVKLQINICGILMRHPVGSMLGKVLHDVFDLVRDASALDGDAATAWNEQRDILRNEVAKKGGIFRAGAYAYFQGSLKINGSLVLKSSKLSVSPFSNPEIGGEIKLGLYAGVRVEASLFGYTGALEATVSVETSWEIFYNFTDNEGAFWHAGVGVSVTVSAEGGAKKGESGFGLEGSVGKEYKMRWCDAGSRKNPLMTFAF